MMHVVRCSVLIVQLLFSVQFFNGAYCSVFSFSMMLRFQCSVFERYSMLYVQLFCCSLFNLFNNANCSVFSFSMMLIVQRSVFNDADCSVFSFQWCLLFSVQFFNNANCSVFSFSMMLIVQCSVFNAADCSVFSFQWCLLFSVQFFEKRVYSDQCIMKLFTFFRCNSLQKLSLFTFSIY